MTYAAGVNTGFLNVRGDWGSPDVSAVGYPGAGQSAHVPKGNAGGSVQERSVPQSGHVQTDGAGGTGKQTGSRSVPVESASASRDLELSEQDLALIRQLSQRDREVRAHEQAHVAAGGGYVRGGAHFTYQVGPDGKQYAVGGEVSIDTAPVPGDPEATMRKAMAVRRSALAPAHPSAQDRNVAALATSLYLKASQEAAVERTDRANGGDGTSGVKVKGGILQERQHVSFAEQGASGPLAWDMGMAAYQKSAPAAGMAGEYQNAHVPGVDLFV